MEKKLGDLRFVIGLFFAVVGIILLLTSVLGPNDEVSGIRLNLVCGAFMGVFGSGMLFLSARGTSDEA